MKPKTFNLSLPEELVVLIDTQARLGYETRSAYIKSAILDRLKKSGVMDAESIQNPDKIYNAFRRKRLASYLANLKISNEDMRS